jgi:hydroxymethylbilane synthase
MTVKRKIIIGSRDSKLAVIQSRIVMELIRQNNPDIDLELITMKTTGDLILDKALDKIGGKGLFVKELEQALRDRRIDLAVHSLKDMPMDLPEDLPILAVSKREDPRDVLVLPRGCDVLKGDGPVGCSSVRRKIQIEEKYPEIKIEPVRGNVETRLRKLDEGNFSGLILAYAGLIRLGLESRVSRIFSTSEMIPSGGQGILAIQGRKAEDYGFLQQINDMDSMDQAAAEREFVRCLDGGCSSPIAAYAETAADEICLNGLYVDIKTGVMVKGMKTGNRKEAREIGFQLAKELLEEANR